MTNLSYIAYGSNLGDTIAMFDTACEALNAIEGVNVLRKSALYRTQPIDVDGEQADFINAVIEVETDLSALQLLGNLHQIEAEQGRVRGAVQNTARTLDLDLLLFNDEMIHTEKLTVPHPRLHQRAFVLAPLSDISPEHKIPGRGVVSNLLAQVLDQEIERL